jgi:hypothetical protein
MKMMKKIILKKILPSLFIILGLLLLWRCEEEILSPNKNGSLVNLHITGKKLNACKGVTDTIIAPYAQFAFVSINGDQLDTLFQGKLDVNGMWDTLYNIELLGIPNVQVHGLLDLRKAVDSIFYVCCDTSFTLNFLFDCNDVSEVEVDCANLNDTVDLELTNQFGGKILLGTPEADIAGNRFQLSPTENVTVNVNELNALAGDFSKRISSSADNNGNIELGIGKQSLVIDFFVKTDKVGVFTKTINLPTTCPTGETGNITINLSSEIIDDDCSCPFSSDINDVKEFHPFTQSIREGKTSPITVNEIINLNDLTLGEGCYLVVDSVVRFNSSVPTDVLQQSGIQYEWKMVSPNSKIELRNGTTVFSMSTTFTPNQVGESTDTFSVNVSIHNSLGETKDACSFLISYTGNSCEDYCPVLVIDNINSAILNPGNSTMRIGDSLYFDSNEILTQRFTGYVNTACEDISNVNVKNLSYKLLIDRDSILNMCENLTIQVTKSGVDASFFDSWFNTSMNLSSSYNGFTGKPLPMGFRFRVPTIDDFLTGGHSNNPVYTCDFTIRAFNNSGFECTQQVHVVATTEQISTKLTDIHTMLTFSQISDVKDKPALRAFSIPGIKNGNEIVKLNETDVAIIGGYTVPSPLYDKDASFFFDVDQPDNKIFRQNPELYLANTVGNQFSHITQYPVETFLTSDAFVAGIENLVRKVFDTNGFVFDGHNFSFSNLSGPMWSNSISKTDFTGNRDGVEIEYGDVYIIWNPGSDRVTNVPGVYGAYCEVAFIYISKVTDGSVPPPNADHLGNVQFMVAYPLSIVK